MIYISVTVTAILSAAALFLTVLKKHDEKRNFKPALCVWALYVLLTVGINVLSSFTDLAAAVGSSALLWILYCCAYNDFYERKIPDYCSVSLAVTGIVKNVYETFFCNGGLSSVWNALLGAGTVLLLMVLSSLLMKNGLGGGDVKMMTALGLYFGFSGLFSLLLSSFLPAALFGLAMLVSKKANLKTGLPLAPFVLCGLSVLFAVPAVLHLLA